MNLISLKKIMLDEIWILKLSSIKNEFSFVEIKLNFYDKKTSRSPQEILLV